MITAKEIMTRIDEALESFGTYSYCDKGAREVMDIPSIVNQLKTMSAEDIVKVLTEVKEKHKDPDPFLQDAICSFDNWKDPKADILFETELFQEYYG